MRLDVTRADLRRAFIARQVRVRLTRAAAMPVLHRRPFGRHIRITPVPNRDQNGVDRVPFLGEAIFLVRTVINGALHQDLVLDQPIEPIPQPTS